MNRVCKKLVGSEFVEANFSSLKKGDIFMLFEPDGMLVKDDNGETVFIAISEVYQNKELTSFEIAYEAHVG